MTEKTDRQGRSPALVPKEDGSLQKRQCPELSYQVLGIGETNGRLTESCLGRAFNIKLGWYVVAINVQGTHA